MYLAPDDEPDDPVEVMQRAEAFAQGHRDEMGAVQDYTHRWRHTQTGQYFASLREENSSFLLDQEGKNENPMPSTARARIRLSMLLAAYAQENPEVDMTATEADCQRLVGAAAEDDDETIVVESDDEAIVMEDATEPMEGVVMENNFGK